MGLSSYLPKSKRPVAPPTPTTVALDSIRERLRALVEKATRVEFQDVLKQANTYGWDRLLAQMPRASRLALVRRMAQAVAEQQLLIREIGGAYDRVLVTITQAADDEIERLERELRQADRELSATSAVALARRRGPSWFTVALAGLGGFWFAHKDNR